MVKKFIHVSLSLLLISTTLLTFQNGSSAQTYNFITEEEFISQIENTSYFQEYEHLLTIEPDIYETVPESGVAVGRVARYEFEYDLSDSQIVKMNSYLTFAYEYATGNLEAFLIDYGKLALEKKIYVHYLSDNKHVEAIDMSEDEALNDFFEELEVKVEDAMTEYYNELEMRQGDEFSTLNDIYCWRCTEYQEVDDDRSWWCDQAFTIGCGILGGTVGLASWILCSGVQMIACWIPAYRICVDGYWNSDCPIP